MNATPATLIASDLCVDFDSRTGPVRILHHIGFTVAHGQTLGLVGESGCGKSMTALALMRLIPSPGTIAHGSALLQGEDIFAVSEDRMRNLRGSALAMIFQEPMTSLNPVFTVGSQIRETLREHRKLLAGEAREQAVELLRAVYVPDPERRVNAYPHQLSGGMRQRVMIAMALACNPALLIADEPTTALDATVQAQIFDLLHEVQEQRGTSIILVTHDFGAVAEMADRIIVMYAGHSIEEGSVEEIVGDPRHPYTQGLLRCVPSVGQNLGQRKPLAEIPGTVPDLRNLGAGCPFSERCSHVLPKCSSMPPAFVVGPGRMAACWLVEPKAHQIRPS